MKRLIVLGVCLVLMLGTSSFAVVIGDWEGSPDGWIDWSTGGAGGVSVDDPSVMPSKFDYGTVGATLGSQSLKLTQTGWSQSLAIDLTGQNMADFLANDTLSFDLSIGADWLLNGTGGWSQIEQIVINADGLGWVGQLSGSTGQQYWWDGSPDQTTTVTLDYSAAKAAIAPSPTYIQIIFETNGQRDDGSSIDFYFDNMELTSAIPEPATLSLLGLGAFLLRRKK